MAQTANINIKIDSTQAEGSINKFNSTLTDTTTQVGNLKSQLRTMTNELQGLEPGTQRFNELSTAAGKLKDQIQDTSSVIKATAGSAVENLSTAFSKTAGVGISAFQGIGGAMAMFGGDAEQIQMMMGRLQGAMAMGQALKDFGSLGDTFTDIKSAVIAAISKMGLFTTATVTQTAATGAQAGATVVANTAQKSLNLSMLANPIFLVIAGLTALVAAFMIFSSEAEVAEGMNDRINASYERTTSTLSDNLDKLQQRNSTILKLMELEGASITELHHTKLKQMGEENVVRQDSMLEELKAIQEKRTAHWHAMQEGNFELAKSIAKEIQQHRDKRKTLIAEQTKYYDDTKILNQEFENEKLNQEKLANEKAEAKQKEYNSRRNSAITEIRKAEQDAADAKLSEEDREVVIVNRKYNDLVNLAKKYGEDTTKLEGGRVNELKVITDKYNLIELNSKNELIKKESDAREKYYDYLNSLETDAEIVRLIALDDEVENLDKMLAEKTISLDEYNTSVKNATIKTQKDIEKINADSKAKEDDIKKTQQKDDDAAAIELMNKKIAQAQYVADQISQIMDIINELQNRKNEAETAQREMQYNTDVEMFNKQLASKVISREEYDNQIALLDQQKEQQELNSKRKAFKQQKAIQVVNATIQGIMATMAAYASGVATPIIGVATGPIYAAIAAGFSAVQIGLIASQQFKAAKGGIVPGSPSGMDSVNSLLSPGEMVINSQSSSMFPELLSMINQAGGGNSLSPQTPGKMKTSGVSIFQDNTSQPSVRAYVVESEITDKQKRVNRIERAVQF